MQKNTIFKIISYFCSIMNAWFIVISLRVRVIVSCCFLSLFFFISENSYASEQQVSKQTIETPADKTTVRGRVVDTNGEPLIGATVREKGGANGTVTDVDGLFFLSVPDSAVLQISFVGYETTEVRVAGRAMLEITLQENAIELDHVIVTALGLEKDEATLAYSAQKIKGEELSRVKEIRFIR